MTTTLTEVETTPTADVAGQVRAALQRRGMSGREFARRTPRDSQYWWRRFSGAHPLDVEDLATVASVLEVSVASLIAPLDDARGRQPIGGYGPVAGHEDVSRADLGLAA